MGAERQGHGESHPRRRIEQRAKSLHQTWHISQKQEHLMPGRVPGAGCFLKLLPSGRTIIHINEVDKNEGLLRGEKGKEKNERKEE